MNNPSPLVPQGSFLEQKNKSRARVRFAVFFVLSVHVVGLMAALSMQGCRREEPATTTETMTESNTELALPSFVEPTNNEYIAPTSSPTTFSNTSPMPMDMTSQIPAAPSTQEYTIVRGDTLSGIAKKFPGVTWMQIRDANPGIDPNRLQPGKKLVIPAPASAPAVVNPTTTTPGATEATGGGEQIYTVKSGDNLTKIANNFHTTVRAIRSLNNLTTDRIRVGDKLKIPASAAAPAATTTPGITNP